MFVFLPFLLLILPVLRAQQHPTVPWQVTQSNIKFVNNGKSVSYNFEIRADAPKFQATCNSTSPLNTVEKGYKARSWSSISAQVTDVATKAALGPKRKIMQENWISVNVTQKDPVAVWSIAIFADFDTFLEFYPTYTWNVGVPDELIGHDYPKMFFV